jgi:hypothetical protein
VRDLPWSPGEDPTRPLHSLDDEDDAHTVLAPWAPDVAEGPAILAPRYRSPRIATPHFPDHPG